MTAIREEGESALPGLTFSNFSQNLWSPNFFIKCVRVCVCVGAHKKMYLESHSPNRPGGGFHSDE